MDREVLKKLIMERYQGLDNIKDPREREVVENLLRESYDANGNPSLRSRALLTAVMGGEELKDMYTYASLLYAIGKEPQMLYGEPPRRENWSEEDYQALMDLHGMLSEADEIRESIKQALAEGKLRGDETGAIRKFKEGILMGKEFLSVVNELGLSKEEIQKLEEKFWPRTEFPEPGRKFFGSQVFSRENIDKAMDYYLRKHASNVEPLRIREDDGVVEVNYAENEEQEKMLRGMTERLKKAMGLDVPVRVVVADIEKADKKEVMDSLIAVGGEEFKKSEEFMSEDLWKDFSRVKASNRFYVKEKGEFVIGITKEALKDREEALFLIGTALGHIKNDVKYKLSTMGNVGARRADSFDNRYENMADMGQTLNMILTGRELHLDVAAACKVARSMQNFAEMHAVEAISKAYGIPEDRVAERLKQKMDGIHQHNVGIMVEMAEKKAREEGRGEPLYNSDVVKIYEQCTVPDRQKLLDYFREKVNRINPRDSQEVGNFIMDLQRAREQNQVEGREETLLMKNLMERIVNSGVDVSELPDYISRSVQATGKEMSMQTEEKIEKLALAMEDNMRAEKQNRFAHRMGA